MAEHRWSGWPGAWCLDCHAEDALEKAVGLGWYDPYDDKWDNEEHWLEVEKCAVCPVEEKKPIAELYKRKEQK